MDINYYVLILLWVATLLIFVGAIPRNRLREAVAVLLFFQMLTWLFSICLTFAGLLESPIRIFKYATKISFTSEYAVFPTFAVLFHLSFPKNAKFVRRMFHYLLWVGLILLFMFLIGTFTDIMTVKPDNIIRSFFNFIIELWLCRLYILWLLNPGKKVNQL